ncbi:MAG: chorismate mutase [Bacteroidales bacterium]
MRTDVEVETAAHKASISNILKKSGKLIIAGPCAAESQEQLLTTAKALAADGRTHFLRAGAWKPRTKPGNFQGMGVEALKWLRDVKIVTGLPAATEVASERHVYEALKYGIDLLWIGARTVSNPFAVQEIAEAIRGVDIPVLVKNPLSPDIDLWEGAITRFSKAGINEIGAIHRGFSWLKKTKFRNEPLWEIPNELKSRLPEIPIICDPSHIAGNSSLVPIIAQRAMKNKLDGLMVEVHPNPEVALSDSKQQLTPNEFTRLLSSWLNKEQSEQTLACMLEELRSEVDTIDELLIWALANRMKLSKEIAGIKGKGSLNIIQSSRWNDVVLHVTQIASAKGLNPSFVKKLFNTIHKESCSVQKKHSNNVPKKSSKERNFMQ